MFSIIARLVVGIVSLLNRWLPSFRLINRIVYRRDSHKWGVPAMLLAVPYWLVANILKGLLEDGGGAWLSLPMLWCLVMGIVIAMMGPVGLILLAKARSREAVARWRERRQHTSADTKRG